MYHWTYTCIVFLRTSLVEDGSSLSTGSWLLFLSVLPYYSISVGLSVGSCVGVGLGTFSHYLMSLTSTDQVYVSTPILLSPELDTRTSAYLKEGIHVTPFRLPYTFKNSRWPSCRRGSISPLCLSNSMTDRWRSSSMVSHERDLFRTGNPTFTERKRRTWVYVLPLHLRRNSSGEVTGVRTSKGCLDLLRLSVSSVLISSSSVHSLRSLYSGTGLHDLHPDDDKLSMDLPYFS